MRLVERVVSVMLYGYYTGKQVSSGKKHAYNQQNLLFVLQVFVCQSSSTSCLHVFSADTQNISDGHDHLVKEWAGKVLQ